MPITHIATTVGHDEASHNSSTIWFCDRPDYGNRPLDALIDLVDTLKTMWVRQVASAHCISRECGNCLTYRAQAEEPGNSNWKWCPECGAQLKVGFDPEAFAAHIVDMTQSEAHQVSFGEYEEDTWDIGTPRDLLSVPKNRILLVPADFDEVLSLLSDPRGSDQYDFEQSSKNFWELTNYR